MEANLSPLSAEYAVLDQVVEAWAESSLDLAVIVVRSGDENQSWASKRAYLRIHTLTWCRRDVAILD